MPRKPTGNPTGRPPGSGPLGDQVQRLTIRLPADLYQRLEAFAEGRTYTRGTPQLAGCARDLLEHALACPYKRQTENIPLLSQNSKRLPENETPDHEDTFQQPIIVPSLSLDEPVQHNWQPESETTGGREENRQSESVLAPRTPLPAPQRRVRVACGHPPERWNPLGRVCKDCQAEKAKAKRDAAKAQRQAAVI